MSQLTMENDTPNDNRKYMYMNMTKNEYITANDARMRGNLPGLFDDETFDKDNLVSSCKQMKNIYHLWLIDDVGESKLYLKWFDILQSATENDLVVIHINSYGGDVMTTVQLITQIKTCEAQVVCQIESACCSAATMVALACDGLLCYPHGYMMIHTSSGYTFGKQSDIRRQEDFYNDWLDTFFNEVYKDFLSKKEIEDVLNGKDMWLTSEEVMNRFRHRVDIINKETAKMQKQEKEHMKKLHSFMSNLQHGEDLNEVMEDSDETKKTTKKKPAKKPSKKTSSKKTIEKKENEVK